jgi:hypothetical protein
MKKPALIQTTVRLFPAKESETATTRTTIKGHVIGGLYLSSLESRKNLLSRFLKNGLASYMSCTEILEKASENGTSGYVVIRGARVWHINKLIYLLMCGRP